MQAVQTGYLIYGLMLCQIFVSRPPLSDFSRITIKNAYLDAQIRFWTTIGPNLDESHYSRLPLYTVPLSPPTLLLEVKSCKLCRSVGRLIAVCRSAGLSVCRSVGLSVC